MRPVLEHNADPEDGKSPFELVWRYGEVVPVSSATGDADSTVA